MYAASGALSHGLQRPKRLVDLAAARKPLPVDHPTSALAYRVKDLATPKKQRRAAPSMDPYPRPSQQQSGPSLGL